MYSQMLLTAAFFETNHFARSIAWKDNGWKCCNHLLNSKKMPCHGIDFTNQRRYTCAFTTIHLGEQGLHDSTAELAGFYKTWWTDGSSTKEGEQTLTLEKKGSSLLNHRSRDMKSKHRKYLKQSPQEDKNNLLFRKSIQWFSDWN